MTEIHDRVCVTCGAGPDTRLLEACSICQRHFCVDCAFKGYGRKFCSADCGRSYYFTGEIDDDEDRDPD